MRIQATGCCPRRQQTRPILQAQLQTGSLHAKYSVSLHRLPVSLWPTPRPRAKCQAAANGAGSVVVSGSGMPEGNSNTTMSSASMGADRDNDVTADYVEASMQRQEMLVAEFMKLVERTKDPGVKGVLRLNQTKLVKNEVTCEKALEVLTLEDLMGYQLSRAAAGALKVAFPAFKLPSPPAPAPGPLPIPDWYKASLGTLPAPKQFAQYWPDWQDMDDDIVFNCLRPSTAQSTSPALMHRAFGTFLDRVASERLDMATIGVILTLINEMSESCQDTTGKAAREVTRKTLGDDHMGKGRGQDCTRAQLFRDRSLELFKLHVQSWPSAVGREPSSADEDAEAGITGSLHMKDSSGRVIAQLLIMASEEGVGSGSNGDPLMHMLCAYAKLAASQWDTPLVRQTCYPAIGIEVGGNMFRLHALYLTDKISSQPLTPMLHLSDMRFAVPGYTEMVARTLKAAVLLLSDLAEDIRSWTQGQLPDARVHPGRNPEVLEGIPHPLRNRFASVIRCYKKHAYICEDSGDNAIIAKVVPGPYPTQLHRELERIDLVPRLLDSNTMPGGFTLVETEYLDPQDGWCTMDRCSADMVAMEDACRRALAGLATCLGGKAVHGYLRVPNIYVRVGADGKAAVRFVDLDWAGAEGEAQYPPFINECIPTDVGPITQQIDQQMLAAALEQVLARRLRAS